ncbi:hypothetical protein G7062_08845 [Erysipelothrix sp. HDW6C]|uniref:hypothetical protein n=1 Tax=Erysipelothrix sp. HDW6C TaxID=2714930 RepID=UPI0014076D01|nr:hypothetical protein [Erysipelothrix sp. HDW6C]QIK70399.1 hypothetical protein G7062_08845 [Erysipelothrix sp. HDW6C]
MKSFKLTLALFSLLLATCTVITPLHAEEDVLTPEELKQVKEAGTYFTIVYTVDDQGRQHSERVPITIVLDTTILNDANNEGIDAHDFRIQPDVDIESLDPTTLINLANAHAWDLSTGTKIPITTVTITPIQDRTGHIKYATDKGSEISVTVHVFDTVVFNLSQQNLQNNSFEFSNLSQQSIPLLLLLILPFAFYFITLLRIRNEEKVVDSLLEQRAEIQS